MIFGQYGSLMQCFLKTDSQALEVRASLRFENEILQNGTCSQHLRPCSDNRILQAQGKPVFKYT